MSLSNHDRRSLKNWQKWLQERARLQNYLAQCLQRNVGDLVMNLSEQDLRMMREEQTLIDYTRIETHVDAYRGSPNFWKLPIELVFRKNRRERTFLFKDETLEERGLVPVLEQIGVPQRILEEKHVFPRTRSLWRQWNQLEYRKMQMERLQKKLEKIQPHRPDFQDLIVVGNRIEKSEIKPKVVIEEDETSKTTSSVTESTTKKPKSPRTITLQTPLIINDVQFYPNELNTTKSFVIAFTDFNVQTKHCAIKYLTIENKNTIPLRLNFRPIEPYNLFHDLIPERKQGVAFFFKRNDIILTPGEKLDLPIRFKTSKPGSYSEIWELCTSPKLWREPAKVTLKLKGFADVTTTEKCKSLAQTLEKNVEERLIKDTISELLHGVHIETKRERVNFLYYYDESRLFETINSELTAFNNQPKYKYNEVIVANLKRIYEEVKRESVDPAEWNYSIEDLRALVAQTEKFNEFEEAVSHLETSFTLSCNYNNNYRIFYCFLNAAITEICNDLGRLQDDLGVVFEAKYPATTMRSSKSFYHRNGRRNESKRSKTKSEDSGVRLATAKRNAKSSSQRLVRGKSSAHSRSRTSRGSIFSLEKIVEERQATVNIPEHLNTQYKHNLYATFYSKLCNAIDAIETAIVDHETELSHKSLKTIQTTNQYYNTTTINIKTIIDEILQTIPQKQQAMIPQQIIISYPERIFLPTRKSVVDRVEVEKMLRSTSTLEGGKLDPNWLDFKEIAAQTSTTSTEFDLVRQVEVLQEATSLQDVRFGKEVACQKEMDEHVSDEEHFYSSEEEEKKK